MKNTQNWALPLNILFLTSQNKSIAIIVFLGLPKHLGKTYLKNTVYSFSHNVIQGQRNYSPLHLRLYLGGNHGS